MIIAKQFIKKVNGLRRSQGLCVRRNEPSPGELRVTDGSKSDTVIQGSTADILLEQRFVVGFKVYRIALQVLIKLRCPEYFHDL